jgi:sec-independent protein translocase protein TatB
MFDIGWSELVVIGVVALIVIGPKELPGVLRAVGQWTTKIRRMASEFQGQFQEAMREAEMADLKQQMESVKDVAAGIGSINPLESARRELESSFDQNAGAAAAPTAPETTASAGLPVSGPEATATPPVPEIENAPAAAAIEPPAAAPAAAGETPPALPQPPDTQGGRAA